MSDTDSDVARQERQENEVNALKAIFGDELEDRRGETGQGLWEPLNLWLLLKPLQGSSGGQEVYAQLKLHVQCCPTYPDRPPEIKVVSSSGLSISDTLQLQCELEKLAQSMCGQEMIFEIAQHVRGFLHKHNKPGFKSFHEEMLQFQQQQEQHQRQLTSLRQQKERQSIQDEVHRKQEALRAEGRQRKESLRHGTDQGSTQTHYECCSDQSPDTKPMPFKDFQFKTEQEITCEDEDEPDEVINYLPHDSKSQSRIFNEFEVLKFLGKGAFGDVLKVRNKLDGGIYAIKRIKLNPRNRQLNRRITREVKLLSQLNHENVVRYYNSWIESATIEASGSETSSAPASPRKSFRPVKDLEDLTPVLRDSVEWSVSSTTIEDEFGSSSDTDLDSEERDGEPWLGFLSFQDSSDSIVFENGSQKSQDEEKVETETDSSNKSGLSECKTDSIGGQRCIQFMYIQMEFCEKSTLRTAIDKGLCRDEERVWRLFRDIVEGLAHIHQQGMIHRDLKPVNLFLDSQDHVKIGDFGLATMNTLPRIISKEKENVEVFSFNQSDCPLENHDFVEQSLTGQVGTALYVAPEINSVSSKVAYNQMCYPPLKTGMERIAVLHNLRSREITFPSDFPLNEWAKQAHVIRWLLDHEPTRRPSSLELLASDWLPPPQLEDAELQDMVHHTLRNPQSKAYKYLVASCFKQVVGPAEDVTFDMTVLPKGLSLQRLLALQDMAKDVIERVFKKHGASSLSTPLLMPQTAIDSDLDSAVRLMTRWGGIVTMPHDLRANFARYVTWNNITCLKRYAIQRVYREKKVFGFHPRELYDCAFDVVTPSPGSLLLDAELLVVASEVSSELPGLRDCSCAFRLNHSALVRAALIHAGVAEDRHSRILSMCSEARDKKTLKLQLQDILTEAEMAALFGLLEVEGPLSKVQTSFRAVTKRRGPAASLAKQGLFELESTISYAQALGVKCPILVSPVLVRNINLYSGVMCQLVCENKNKRRHGVVEVIAAGGRYDGMISFFRQALDRSGMLRSGVAQSAAGVSICLDKVVTLLHDSGKTAGAVEVVLWFSGRQVALIAASIAKDLWSSGIKCLLLNNSQQEAEEYCREMAVPHMVVLRDTDSSSVRVQSWEKDRFTQQSDRLNERRVLWSELVEFLQRTLRAHRESNESNSFILPIQKSDNKNAAGGDNHVSSYSHNNAHSHRHAHGDSHGHQHHSQINVTFISSERMTANSRRRYENQIHSHIYRMVQRLEARGRIEVLAVGGLDGASVVALAGLLELDTEQDYNESRKLASEKLSASKKYLRDVLDEIFDLRFEKNSSFIVLYSLSDNKFRLLV